MVPSLVSAMRKQSKQRAVSMLEANTILRPIEKMQILAAHLNPDVACRLTLPAPMRAKLDICLVVKMFKLESGIAERDDRPEHEHIDTRLVSEMDLFISKRASLVGEFIAQAHVIHLIHKPRWLIDAENVNEHARSIKGVSPSIYQEYLETRS